MNVLEEALAAVTGPRAAAYGEPALNWKRTADIASHILGHEITPAECVKVLIATKLARLIQTPDHRDSRVDLAGYAWVLEHLYPKPEPALRDPSMNAYAGCVIGRRDA